MSMKYAFSYYGDSIKHKYMRLILFALNCYFLRSDDLWSLARRRLAFISEGLQDGPASDNSQAMLARQFLAR